MTDTNDPCVLIEPSPELQMRLILLFHTSRVLGVTVHNGRYPDFRHRRNLHFITLVSRPKMAAVAKAQLLELLNDYWVEFVKHPVINGRYTGAECPQLNRDGTIKLTVAGLTLQMPGLQNLRWRAFIPDEP